MRWLERFQQWFRLVTDTRPPLTVQRVEDPPDTVLSNYVYLIGEYRQPWSAMFLCPCGCKDVVALSLIRNDRPRWRAREHSNGTVTISPSVWRTKGCRSHFFVQRGKVIWVLASRFDSGGRRTQNPER